MNKQIASFVDDDFCFACGQKNPLGMALSFEILPDGACRTEITPGAHHQGFAGIFHGGLMATVADDLMNNHLFRGFGAYVATVELSIRFKKPAPVGLALVFTSRLAKSTSTVYEMTCEVRGKDEGALFAVATGRFMRVSSGRMKSPAIGP